jgi:hypothetical protein
LSNEYRRIARADFPCVPFTFKSKRGRSLPRPTSAASSSSFNDPQQHLIAHLERRGDPAGAESSLSLALLPLSLPLA